MLTSTKKRVAFLTICIVLALLLIFGIWSSTHEKGKRVMEIDMPIYSSIEELLAYPDLDAVVIGTVIGIAGHEIDYGTSNPIERTGSGIPIVFYEVEVTEVLHGAVDKTVIVSMIDTKSITVMSDNVTPCKTGEQLLLFLEARDSAHGIKSFDHFYTPVSLDNGVFDILPGDMASPRLEYAFNLSSDKLDEPTTFTLDEIREIISNDN
jgi:hypothetical protein